MGAAALTSPVWYPAKKAGEGIWKGCKWIKNSRFGKWIGRRCNSKTTPPKADAAETAEQLPEQSVSDGQQTDSPPTTTTGGGGGGRRRLPWCGRRLIERFERESERCI